METGKRRQTGTSWEITIKTGKGMLSIPVIRSRRKTLTLQVGANGTVAVRAPWQVKKHEVELFVEKNMAWILRTRMEMELKRDRQQEIADQYHIPAYEELTPMEKNIIRRHFMERVKFYAPQMGVTYNNITIRNQKGRWGSCSSKGNLNFNYRLHYLPQELMDYVVVHELAHRVYMNHSGEFWNLVGQYHKEYKESRRQLREIGIH